MRNDHTPDLTFTVPVSTADGSYTVPQVGTLQLNGKDMKVIVAGYQLDSAHLVYSTSHLMTHAPIGGQDVAVLASRPGDDGETVLRYPAAASGPAVSVLGGTGVTSSWDASTGDLLLDYPHQGVTRIQVAPAGGRPLLLLAVDDTAAGTFWRLDTAAGPVLVSGPALVRTATMRGDVLDLTGDTAAATPLEVWAPRPVGVVFWNGRPVPVTRTASGSLASRNPLSGPPAVDLPALAGWKYAPENPEADPGFDDSGWTLADKTTSASATPVPAGQPVLFVDDYGFHYGDVWYRGSWSGTAGADLGQPELPDRPGRHVPGLAGRAVPGRRGDTRCRRPASPPRRAGRPRCRLPSRRPGRTTERTCWPCWSGPCRTRRTAARTRRSSRPSASPRDLHRRRTAVTWRIQGTLGGEAPRDRVRGPLNNGGLYGERPAGTCPVSTDQRWASVTLPNADPRPGVAWYRTTFRLQVPPGHGRLARA